MLNPTTMTYGLYSFRPVPLMTISKEFVKSGNQTFNIGQTFRVVLTGTLTPIPDDTNGGLDALDILQDELRDAFDRDGQVFEVKCGESVVMRTCPRVLSLNFEQSNNNWVFTTPFTIELEFDADDNAEDPYVPPFIESFNEDWQVEFEQDHRYFTWNLSAVTDQRGGYSYPADDSNQKFVVRVTHNVSAKGKRSFDCSVAESGTPGTMKSAADNAIEWLNGASFPPAATTDSYDYTYAHGLSGILNMDTSLFDAYDHFRSSNVNEADGNVSMTDTWLVVARNTGIPIANRKAIEDFNISIRSGIDSSLRHVSIDGTIRGFVVHDFDPDFSTTSRAYDNASGYWNYIEDRIYPRAQLLYQQDYSAFLNPNPLVKSVAHSPSRGLISYQFEFNDRPCAFISGALTENFQIVDNHPTDVFARIAVLGRAAGPVLQSIDTVTEASREVTIEATMPLPTGCTSISDLDMYNPSVRVAELLCDFEEQLTDANHQVFKAADNESWTPLTGHYSRHVAWTYQNCTGMPNTSLCE